MVNYLVRRKIAIRVFAYLVLVLATAGEGRTADVLRLVGTIPLPDVKGRIDHMAVDADRKRLFVAARGNDTLEVIDLRRERPIRSVGGLYEPQGVLYDGSRRLLYVSNGGDGTVLSYDADTLQANGTVSLPGDADNLRYEKRAQHLYVGYGNGALGIVDTRTRMRIGDVQVGGHPEAFELEESTGRIYVNVPTGKRVSVVERVAQKVTADWPVPCTDNFPMALDEVRHRLFIGCRRPAEVLVYDTEAGRQTAALPIAPDVDDLFYDPLGRRLFASCGSGSLLAFAQRSPDQYELLTEIKTAPGSRTSLFDGTMSRLYVASPQNGKKPAMIMIYEIER